MPTRTLVSRTRVPLRADGGLQISFRKDNAMFPGPYQYTSAQAGMFQAVASESMPP